MLHVKRRPGTRRRASVLNRAARCSIEPLENRLLFSVFTVSSLSDSGAGTLRAAINDANAAGGQNTIDFQSGLTGFVDLNGGALEASQGNITIQGPGPGVITIDGNGTSTIFQVDSGVTANISGLTITDGAANAGGGISNLGILTVTDCVVSDNQATFLGGGIFNGGTLTLTNSTVSGNDTQAGAGISNSGTAFIE